MKTQPTRLRRDIKDYHIQEEIELIKKTAKAEKINDNTIFCGVMVLLSLIYIGLDLLKIYNNIPFTNKDCFFATLNIVLIIFWITSLKKTLNN